MLNQMFQPDQAESTNGDPNQDMFLQLNQPGLGNETEGIRYPGKHDVMLGRGGDSNYHSGNLTFRQFVESFKDQYRAARRNKKTELALQVVHAWRDLTPPGRFLARTYPDRVDSLWHEVRDEIARKRASKNLAETESPRQRKQVATKAIKGSQRQLKQAPTTKSSSSSKATTTSTEELMGSGDEARISEECASAAKDLAQPNLGSTLSVENVFAWEQAEVASWEAAPYFPLHNPQNLQQQHSLHEQQQHQFQHPQHLQQRSLHQQQHQQSQQPQQEAPADNRVESQQFGMSGVVDDPWPDDFSVSALLELDHPAIQDCLNILIPTAASLAESFFNEGSEDSNSSSDRTTRLREGRGFEVELKD